MRDRAPGRRRLAVIVATGVLAIGSCARGADAPAPAWQGVWRGTIGALPVQACLDHRDYADRGAYYYMSHLSIIALGRIDKGGAGVTFSEAADSDTKDQGPLWVLSPARGGDLAGEWRFKTKTLPIRLTRLAAADGDDGPCSSLAFSGPRVTPITITSKPAIKDGVAYTRLIASVGRQFDVTLESFEMSGATSGATAADRRIDAILRKRLPERGQGSDYLDCTMGALGANGHDGAYSDVSTPTFITRRWLVSAETSATDCGGAHPSESLTSTVFDRATGDVVDLWTWFTPGAVTRHAPEGGAPAAYEVAPPLLKAIVARWHGEDSDCRQAFEDQTFWDVALTRQGFGFTPMLPHVAQACAEQVVLPYGGAAPFLNAAGRAGVASVMSDRM
jgi:hypothetical protein